MNQGPKWILLMKKSRAVKSRATVPLNKIDEVCNVPATSVMLENIGELCKRKATCVRSTVQYAGKFLQLNCIDFSRKLSQRFLLVN
jgi:hypothetical protein